MATSRIAERNSTVNPHIEYTRCPACFNWHETGTLVVSPTSKYTTCFKTKRAKVCSDCAKSLDYNNRGHEDMEQTPPRIYRADKWQRCFDNLCGYIYKSGSLW